MGDKREFVYLPTIITVTEYISDKMTSEQPAKRTEQEHWPMAFEDIDQCAEYVEGLVISLTDTLKKKGIDYRLVNNDKFCTVYRLISFVNVGIRVTRRFCIHPIEIIHERR